MKLLVRFVLCWSWIGLQLSNHATAQPIPIGTWRTHVSYRSATELAVAGEKVFSGSTGSFFFFDKAFNNATKLSQIDGFSETGASAIRFHPTLKLLVIAYPNGGIDILSMAGKAGEADKITHVNMIRDATLTSEKTIYHIEFKDNLAYISGAFGLALLDLKKLEIKETYQNIGVNGAQIAVFASATTNDSLFLASSQGVLVATLAANVNLQDFRNWKTFTPSEGIPAAGVKSVVSLNDRVYAGVSQSGIYAFSHGQWQSIYSLNQEVNGLNASNNQLLVSLRKKLVRIQPTNQSLELTDALIDAPQAAEYDAEGKLWIADATNGLISNASGPFQAAAPNGPVSNQIWKLYPYEHQLVALPGGFDDKYNRLNRAASFSVFDGASWKNRMGLPNDPLDLVAVAYDSRDKKLYLGSFGNGLFVQNPDQSFAAIDDSPLVGYAGAGARVGGLAVDEEGNLWVTNHSVASGQPSLHVKRRDNSWQSFSFAPSNARNPLDILIDFNGYKWLRLSPQTGSSTGGGILVFDEKKNQSRLLTSSSGQGDLPNNQVRAMVMDKEGQIWVGTDAGVAVFFDPSSVFTSANYGAVTPYYNNRELLNNEYITALGVDGGNRKWIGTRNGLWLFNSDGSELITKFTKANSPLLSNYIVDIQVDPISGEVFIATDQGLISYRGTATEAEATYSQVNVFPNPVRPDFNGLIGISGLAANASIKITDVAGRLVYETQANGGTATWNGKDYNGRKAQTGVYLVFSASEDGPESLVTKIAVVK